MLLRAIITKGEPVRYISHLDFARTVERGLRRARLPVAYSEGFNPHVKLAFASAMGVGVIGAQEYFDVELTQAINPAQFVAQLAGALPAGITVGRAVAIPDRSKSLMALINYATYTVNMPLLGEAATALAAVERFNLAAAVPYTRISPKGKREIDLKQFVRQPIVAEVTGENLLLTFGVEIMPAGSVKASEVITVLTEQFALPANSELALIQRDGLWIRQGDNLVSPLDFWG